MPSRTVTKLVLAVGLSAAAATAFSAGAEPELDVVPIEIVESLGHLRPMVEARFNGHPIQMMIHSHSSNSAQLKHRHAAAFGIVKTGTHGSFGIDGSGHLSTLGRDTGTVATLAVGSHVDRDVTVDVFEVPQDNYGMLGIDWIRRNRVIVDYRQKNAVIAPDERQAKAIGRTLLKAGYVALPIHYDPTLPRYMVDATINGVTRRMVVATASSFTMDTAFAGAAGVKHGADRGHGKGPTGARVPDYALAEPLRVTVDGWTSPRITAGDVMDEYGYDGAVRPSNPADAIGGSLGGDFLIKTEAVVDFGRSILYVRNGQR